MVCSAFSILALIFNNRLSMECFRMAYCHVFRFSALPWQTSISIGFRKTRTLTTRRLTFVFYSLALLVSETEGTKHNFVSAQVIKLENLRKNKLQNMLVQCYFPSSVFKICTSRQFADTRKKPGHPFAFFFCFALNQTEMSTQLNCFVFWGLTKK